MEGKSVSTRKAGADVALAIAWPIGTLLLAVAAHKSALLLRILIFLIGVIAGLWPRARCKPRTMAAVVVPLFYIIARQQMPGGLFWIIGLVLWALEVFLLWPLAWHLRAKIEIYWLALIIGPVVIPFILIFITLLGSAPMSVETTIWESGLLLVSSSIGFVVSSMLIAWLAAKFADPEIRCSAGRVLRAELGDQPGAYWMAILWVVLGIAAVSFLLSFLYLITHEESALDQAGIRLSGFAIPVALAVAALHRIATRLEALRWRRRVAIVTLAIVLAVGVYLVSFELPFLPRLLDVDAPGAFSRLIPRAWQTLTLVTVFALVVTRRHRLPAMWRIIIVGVIAGAVLVIVLAYPVCTLAYARFVPGSEYTGPVYTRMVYATGFLGTLVILAIGPMAVLWAQPQSRQGRLVVGALAGALAATFVFGGLGGSVAGLIAQHPLYGVALSRAGYSPAEWTFRVAIAVNATFPVTYGAFWLLVSGGALIGGLTGLLTPIRPALLRQSSVAPAHWLPFILVAVPLVAVSTLVNWGILTALGPAIQRMLDLYGFVPIWNPAWLPFAGAGQPWLTLAVIQALGLHWLYKGLMPRRRLAAAVALFTGLIGLALPLLVWPIFPNPLSLTAALITAALGLETLAAGWRLWRLAENGATQEPTSTDQSDWTAGGAVGGLLGTIFSCQLPAAAFSVTLIAINMLPDLAQTTAPPPGLVWLNEVLSSLFGFSPLAFVGLAAIYMAFGALAGFALAHWPWQWALWLWPHLQAAAEKVRATIIIIGRRRYTCVMAILVGIAMIVAASSVIPWLAAFCVLTAIVTIALIQQRLVERLPLPVIALAFVVSLTGFVGLALQGPYKLPLDALWLRPTYTLLVGVAAGVTYRALLAYTPERSRPGARLMAFLGIALLVGLIGYASQEVVRIEGGVSRYNGRYWEVFNSDNSALGDRLNYQFFEDSRGRLWYGGSTGTIAERTASGWRLYFVQGSTAAPLPEEWLGARLHFLEDQQGRLWVAGGKTFGQFDPAMETTGYHLRIPSRPPAESGQFTVTLTLHTKITGMTLDTTGNIWLATDGSGALRLEGNRAVDDARWEFFTVENSGLASDDVRSVYADRVGNVWLGTASGLARYDGTTWKTITAPGPGADEPVLVFLEDSGGRLWMGTAHGGYWWDGQTWTAFDNTPGWASGSGVEALFEDEQGGLWAGTGSGVFRFDGQMWTNVVPGMHVTAFAEGPQGVIWIGTQTGLIRYNLATGEQNTFDSTNSGMITDWVQDLHVDSDGGLWVSTFTIDRTARSPWWAIGLSVLFFGYLFVSTYRKFRPELGQSSVQ